MAAKFRKIDPRIWTDERFVALDSDGKLLALWILTSTRINRCGILIWSAGLASDETGLSRDCIDTVFDTVCHTMNWPYDTVSKALFMPRFFKHNTPPNPKALKGMLSDLDDIPTFDVKPLLLEALRYIPDKLKILYKEQIQYRIDRVSAQEKEKEKEKEDLKPVPHTPRIALPDTAPRTPEKTENAPEAQQPPIAVPKAQSPGEKRDNAWEAILERCNGDLAKFLNHDLPELGFTTYEATNQKKRFFDDFEIVWQNHPVHNNRPTCERVWRWLVRTEAIRDCVVRGHAAWLSSGCWDTEFVQHLDKWLKELNFREKPSSQPDRQPKRAKEDRDEEKPLYDHYDVDTTFLRLVADNVKWGLEQPKEMAEAAAVERRLMRHYAEAGKSYTPKYQNYVPKNGTVQKQAT
jgi:hypothetical protein